MLLGIAIAGCLIVFLFSGAGYAYVIGALSIVLMLFFGFGEHLALLPQKVFSRLDVFAYMALPLFLLAGGLMGRGGVMDALIEFAMRLMGRTRGALGHVNILTSVFFAGVSGSAIADAASLGNTLVPVMRRRGYSAPYAAAITAASAIIGPIIPPSTILIMYGALMEADIAALFIAGVVPGLLLASGLMVIHGVIAVRQNHERGEAFALSAVLSSGRLALPALMLPVLVLAGIVGGLTTPTEAGAMAVLAALWASHRYGRLSRSGVLESLRRAAMLTGVIFMMIASVSMVSYLAALSGFASWLSLTVAELGLSATSYAWLMVLILILCGMVTSLNLSLFLVVPLLVPEAVTLGLDPLHVGIMTCLALTLGLLTPPFGPILLVTSSVTGVPYWSLVRQSFLFILVEALILVVVVAAPEISLFLVDASGIR